MIGQSGLEKAKGGRPKKKPGYSRDDQINKLIDSVVSMFGEPYDDRDERPDDAPSIEGVAMKLNLNPVKVRKLLITADYFTSEMSRKVQMLYKQGLCITEIMEQTGLGQASVYSYLPYSKGAYKLKEPTLYAEQTRLFRRRKRVCENLEDHLDQCDVCEYLWNAIVAFENYPFIKGSNERFRYSVDCDQICCNGLRMTRKDIERAFARARKIQIQHGCVKQAESLGCTGSEELLAIFLRIGVCRKV